MRSVTITKKRGFTLLELLIVIAIIAILSTIIIFILNPANTLRKSRDSQRIADLSSLNRAIGLYRTEMAIQGKQVILATGDDRCQENGIFLGCAIYYSGDGIAGSQDLTILFTFPTLDLGQCAGGQTHFNFQDGTTLDGRGWAQVNFQQMAGGSLSRLPLDPNFSVADLTNPSSSDNLYTFTCRRQLDWELNANLESNEFRKGGKEDKESTDGGDNVDLYETGTNLRLLIDP